MKRLLSVLLCAVLLLCALLPACASAESPEVYTARPSVNGRLHVEGTQLVDQSGRPVQLRGVSTHGLSWYPEYISENLFRRIAAEWNCNMIRIAMYSVDYCNEKLHEDNLDLMRKGIEAAIAADVYVLVDWHILEDYNPNMNKEAAKGFFAMIAEDYAQYPNLIFEICNEPNGNTFWSEVADYANEVIPVIRSYIPDAVIVVGTTEYDRNLGDPLLRPLEFDNIMYVLHFYCATHHEGLLGELSSALKEGLPVFISECGICEASGDGEIDFESAAIWFSFLNDNKLSYAVWSLSNKEESSAFFTRQFDPEGELKDEYITESGKWVRSLIRGEDPIEISAPAAQVPVNFITRLRNTFTRSLGTRTGWEFSTWLLYLGIAGGVLLLAVMIWLLARRNSSRQKRRTYYDIIGRDEVRRGKKGRMAGWICLILAAWASVIYMIWRFARSIPFESGWLAVTANIVLLIVELVGFFETLILYRNLLSTRTCPLPEIPEDAWPEVDIFIATYNEPPELLRKTLNGCVHIKYPDPSKVHIWLCDDNRRPEMRALAKEMGVGYFDRPDNEGAKAGNLNHAMALTSAPYIVTLDADMIPRSDFLLKTIPYFVDAELREEGRPEGERLRLGLLQTPQCFYDPDVFQHALYCEKRAPNEQDFFYRTIEPAKTGTNSVIYGGSNTVLSRRALEDIGGFFTGSITEDFATGMLIESAGYVSLALPEPLASGQTPHTFKEHIQQRTRWARGVIVTARKLKLLSRKNLSFSQKISYLSSVSYWYSPLKNLIYLLSPLLYAAFMIPVFRCNWLELLLFWLPMFILQDLSLRLNSRNLISIKWSGIYETSVMPHLLIPVLKETFGITLSTFKVTDKSGAGGKRKRDFRSMLPFLVLIALSVVGIVRVIIHFQAFQVVSLLILLFWIIRNLYYLIMSLFLVDGRDYDGEVVRVNDAELVQVAADDQVYSGVTTNMTEHSVTVFLDEVEDHQLDLGARVNVTFQGKTTGPVIVSGVVTDVRESRRGTSRTQRIEILDDHGNHMEYLQLLYDRVPTLPQSLHKDHGALVDLWQNIAHRVARTIK